MKKIVFITENVSWGGSELLWAKTAVELVLQGYDIEICVSERLNLPEWLQILEIKDNFKINRIQVPGLTQTKKVLNRFLPYNNRFFAKDQRKEYIQTVGPSLLIINQGFNFNSVALMDYAEAAAINYITISHAVNEALWPDTVLRQKMLSGFANSVMNYFVSMDNLEVTEAQIGHKLQNANIIRNPFNVDYNAELDYPQSDTFNLACVGRYEFYAKGQDVLLRVFSQPKWKQRNLVINFYGEGRDYKNLEDLIILYDLKNVVINNQTNTIDIWKNNHGLILTSRFEGLPIVLVEAMLCKRFAIITDVSGSGELVMDNKTGFLAAAPRPKYVDEAMERAWQMRDKWNEFGILARQEITQVIPENPAYDFALKLIELIADR